MKKIITFLGLILIASLAYTGYHNQKIVIPNKFEKPSVNNFKPEVKAIQKVLPLDVPSLLEATNKDRAVAGLPALIEDQRLETSASAKCTDMQARNYWSHNTPDGRTPWTFFTYDWPFKGENLARGYNTSVTAEEGWMNSPTHKDNLLKPQYTHVGYAVCQGPILFLVVQHFGG